MSELMDRDVEDLGLDPIEAALGPMLTDRRMAHIERMTARSPSYAETCERLPDRIMDRLPPEGLWSHQAAAIDLIRSGRSTVIATGTASGKSLCYQVPIAEAVPGGATALLIYPTKALAQDQLTGLTAWEAPELLAATYDGDCSVEERSFVRDNANVILTNPEMLHQALLANHRRWGPFLSRLKLVVIDEMHVLRGIFGTNTAHMLRRLRRLIRHYGGVEPTFVFTSATIGHPERLASELAGVEVEVIDSDGSPRGPRSIVLWNPAIEAEGDRWSANVEASRLAATLISAGLRTLVFCPSRRSTELVAEAIRNRLPQDLEPKVRSYRAGYLAEERRQIESDLFGGDLAGIVATSALELGVDIGGLDAVVLCGYPGTIASFRQQIGRTGRSTQPSLAVLVAAENQLDSWMMAHPRTLFDSRTEPAVINLENPFVFVPHIGCAAHELPLRFRDRRYWPTQLDEGVRQLVLTDRARVREHRSERLAAWSGRGSPAPTLSIRSADRGQFTIVDSHTREIGTVDEANLYRSTHVGAIYLHQGRAWRVLSIDQRMRRIVVTEDSGDTYTQARSRKQLRVLSVDNSREVGTSMLHLGSVAVSTQVTGYQVRSASSHELLAREPLSVPANHLTTRAVWYTFGEDLIDRATVDAEQLPGALHAAEHAAIGILPLFTICDRWDVGGVSTDHLGDTGAATIVIHDAYPGGAGMAELAFDVADTHLAATLEILEKCPCADGCPSCVQSPKCGNGNEPLDKNAAVRLLGASLGRVVARRPERVFVGF